MAYLLSSSINLSEYLPRITTTVDDSQNKKMQSHVKPGYSGKNLIFEWLKCELNPICE